MRPCPLRFKRGVIVDLAIRVNSAVYNVDYSIRTGFVVIRVGRQRLIVEIMVISRLEMTGQNVVIASKVRIVGLKALYSVIVGEHCRSRHPVSDDLTVLNVEYIVNGKVIRLVCLYERMNLPNEIVIIVRIFWRRSPASLPALEEIRIILIHTGNDSRRIYIHGWSRCFGLL